ncbi:hypothetical protein [Halotalea alkalilenta]|uniref:YfcL protein n=1 Tax=Halotalea alkalilenta TaxID=376489 RepID=A0A172YFY5_9GAMM|nr:hypothetical protein [Halotalea alkalilenta]ANF58026.1 hypothetical protein A5892_11590 [Halotalea alkalilenta]
MPDPFALRGDQIKNVLLGMEREAEESDLFSLGYMIPQVELVLEMADYDPEGVNAEDFDASYWQWLEHTFAQDAMSDGDQEQIASLWRQALSLA